MCVGRHVQILQNKFAISLEYLTKELKDEVDFLHADKHEDVLQIYFLIGMVKHSQTSQNSNLQCFYNISKKIKLIFCVCR